MERESISVSEMVGQLLRVSHKNLMLYAPGGIRMVREEPELLAHMIAWNALKGEVRDSKKALPVFALRGEPDDELFENAAASMCLLDVRDFVAAQRFSQGIRQGRKNGLLWIHRAARVFLRRLENDTAQWNRVALQHRRSLKTMYAMNHIKPSAYAKRILFERDYVGTVFEVVKSLSAMDLLTAAGYIRLHNLPYLTVTGAIGSLEGRGDKEAYYAALIDSMSMSELLNNTEALKRYGVFSNPVLTEAYRARTQKRKRKDARLGSFKADHAKSKVTDKKAKKILQKVQERKSEELGGIEGDWLVIGDCSISMRASIEAARVVCSVLSEQINGRVDLIFSNTRPISIGNVAGNSYGEILKKTQRIRPGGNTSLGVALDYALANGILVNGIAFCTDGGHNSTPNFSHIYKKYVTKFGIEPTVYIYHVPGDKDVLSGELYSAGIDFERFELELKSGSVDHYMIANLVMTMKARKYRLVDDFMETELLTFKNVFKRSSSRKGG